MRDKKKRLINVPYVDLSYKWAGGGVLSNSIDLIKFGNHMLKYYHENNNETNFLKSSTIKNQLWSAQAFDKTQTDILDELTLKKDKIYYD